jgi:hypothetical protein
MKEAELAAIQERVTSNYTGWRMKHVWRDLQTLLTYVRELQGQVADLWDESRAYELGRMAERGVILATIKKIRQMRNYTWDDPYNGDPAQIALDLVACKLTGPVRPLPYPEQLAAENSLLYAALYRLRNRLGDVPWLTEQDNELLAALKQAIAALNGAKE